jgi:hypothetical protein
MGNRYTSSSWVRNGNRSDRWRAGICGELSETFNSVDPKMAKRFYISTKKDREHEANAISDALTELGWKRTFVWNAQEKNTERYGDIAQQEIDGIRDADVIVVMLPGGFGTHVEIGAALALGKPVILLSPDQKTLETPYPCIFYHHAAVKLIVSESVDVKAIVAKLP